MKIYAKIRFFCGAFVIATVVGVVMVPAVILFNKHKGLIMHKLNRLIMKLIGTKYQIFGQRDESAQLFLINHQGIMDIITLEAAELTHFRWVAKKELFETPWYGLLLRYGDMISVDRENKAGIIKLLKDIKESIEIKKRAVTIFPEGTRVKGQKLKPFKVGAKLAAQKLGLKVQPIVITNSKYVLNEHDRTAHSGTIRVHYLEPIDVKKASKNWYEEIQKRMQEVIDEEAKRGYFR